MRPETLSLLVSDVRICNNLNQFTFSNLRAQLYPMPPLSHGSISPPPIDLSRTGQGSTRFQRTQVLKRTQAQPGHIDHWSADHNLQHRPLIVPRSYPLLVNAAPKAHALIANGSCKFVLYLGRKEISPYICGDFVERSVIVDRQIGIGRPDGVGIGRSQPHAWTTTSHPDESDELVHSQFRFQMSRSRRTCLEDNNTRCTMRRAASCVSRHPSLLPP